MFKSKKYEFPKIKKTTKKVFVDIDWLHNFLDKEGVEVCNSLLASNNILSNGIIMQIKIPLDCFGKKIIKKVKENKNGKI